MYHCVRLDLSFLLVYITHIETKMPRLISCLTHRHCDTIAFDSMPALQQTKTCKNCGAALTNIKFLQKYLKLYFFYNKVIITKSLAQAYDHTQ